MKFSGPDFLKKRFDLHAKPETEAAAKRHTARTGEKVLKPGEKIQTYLDRFKEIAEATDPDKKRLGLKALKRVLHEAHVIKSEDIPESYFKLQQQIARERGIELEITPEMRAEAVKVIQTDQRSTLDEWVDYLASKDARYPDWAKYWAFRSVVGMSLYDKEKKQFGTRSRQTTAPFPDLNQEALAYAVDYVYKEAKGESIQNPVKRGVNEFAQEGKRVTDEEFQHLLSTENFARYYAFAIEHLVSDNEALFKITEGEWRHFEKGSDAQELTKTLQGHGTGWCIAGDATAKGALSEGDLQIYYSNNALGAPVIPRLAILRYHEEIEEVRGVAHKQEVDPYIFPVLEAKMEEFGEEGQQYRKKAENMRRVTELIQKQEAGVEFTHEELRFIYEIDERIEGFGYNRDPRINELREKRDRSADLRKILIEKGDDDTFMQAFLDLSLEQRCNLLGVHHDFEEKEPTDWEEYDEAMRKFFHDVLPTLRNLSTETAQTIMSNWGAARVIEGRAAFGFKDKREMLPLIKKYSEEDGDEEDYELFLKGIFNDTPLEERVAFLKELIKVGDLGNLYEYMSEAGELPHSFADDLIKTNHTDIFARGLQYFAPGFGPETARILIRNGYRREVAENITLFLGLTPEIRDALESEGYTNVFDSNSESFTRAPSAPGTRRWKPSNE